MVKREIDFEPISKTVTKRNILITFNEARKPQNNGGFKLEIDSLSQTLKVYPKNENFNDITAPFDWKIIRSKNILFVLANLDLQDFVLVFKNEEICIKVFNGILKNRDADSVADELLQERFLNPLFKNFSKNWRLKEIFKEWIQKFGEKEKNEYLKILKWHQENPEIDDDENDIKDVKMETDQKPMSRKRRHHEVENYENDLCDVEQFSNKRIEEPHSENNIETVQTPSKMQKLCSTNKFTKVFDESIFKILYHKKNVRICRKLLVFASQEKAHCYEYHFHPREKFFNHYCENKVKGIKAILEIDENGKECVKMEDKKHQCSPILYEPEKYIELKIVKKPDYEILENCATKSRRMLIIFDSYDKNQCFEYLWNSSKKTFHCRGCASKGKQFITAEIIHENTEVEYVVLSMEEHVCKKRKYNPEKYFSSNEIVISPNFEIQMKTKNGVERKTLIIFHGNDRKFCYDYYLINSTKVFICNGCRRKHKIVSAKICKNDENEEYVILSNVKHDCSPRNYVAQNKIIILHPPKFKIIGATEKYKSKLFIFDSTDPNLCYTFSQKVGKKRHYCHGCKAVARLNKNINENDVNHIMTVFLGKDDGPNGEYFVKIDDGEKHICQPQKYDLEKYEIKILKPKIDYILFKDKGRNEAIKRGTYVFHLNIHSKPNTVILEKSGFDFEEPKKKEIDENRIVRLPNFELRRNSKGVPERRLIVFLDNDRKLCYDYRYHQPNSYFLCKKCNVTAKIQNDEENDNEKYVVLGEQKHKCEPVKYEPEKEIIEPNGLVNGISNFMVFNRDDKNKLTKLVIFVSSTTELCYEYSYCKHSKTFRCCRCKVLKKILSAKLMSENGKEYIQLLKNEHVCTPKKFILEEFQPKIIFESGFNLISNRNGKSNSRLFLPDPENEGFAFEYFLDKINYFICLQCRYKKTTVSAKLLEKENGQKFLELSATKHVCESIKYEPEKTKVTNNFVVHYNDSGISDARLTVLNNDDKSLGYRYFLNSRNLFYCVGCHAKKKYSSAKLIIDKEGKQSLEFSKNDHFCTIMNLKNEKLYFYDFKFEENGNILITKDPTQKNRFFKFAYDKKLGTFCCSKCLEKKKKYITATICKENDQKEFVLLNAPHCCVFV